MSSGVELDHITVKFGNFTAVKDATLDIKGGEFFSFLGPSGCGKTTILRTVSGFLDPSSGVVRIGGEDMAGIGPNKRPTALIFQNLALFPLMTVSENITYGLRVRGVDKAARMKRADELLDLIALPDQGKKLVSELSGGQKQRVAIARALAVEPKVLLLDEPLSALDLKLRQHMRNELREIQKRVGITFIYITHDQGEALTMSDRVAVMSDGEILQIADGKTIYDSPATSFVASFVGENNPLPGRVTKAGKTGAVLEDRLRRIAGRQSAWIESGRQGHPLCPSRIHFTRQGRRRCHDHLTGPECRVRRQCQPHFHERRRQEGPFGDRRPPWRGGNPGQRRKGCRQLRPRLCRGSAGREDGP